MMSLNAGSKVDSSQIKQLSYGLAMFYQWKFLNFGVQYQTVPNVSVSQFILSDNSAGTYNLSFVRNQFLIGGKYNLWRFYYLIGSETIGWSGTPNLQKSTATYSHSGFQLSYDLWKQPRVTAPIVLTMLNHGQRKNEFTNYPNDTITFDAASEIILSAAFAFDF